MECREEEGRHWVEQEIHWVEQEIHQGVMLMGDWLEQREQNREGDM